MIRGGKVIQLDGTVSMILILFAMAERLLFVCESPMFANSSTIPSDSNSAKTLSFMFASSSVSLVTNDSMSGKTGSVLEEVSACHVLVDN